MDTEAIQQSAAESVEGVVTDMSDFSKLIQDNFSNIFDYALRAVIALIIFLIGRALIKWIRKSVGKSFEKRNTDKGIAQFTDSLIKYGLYVLLILVIAGNLGIDLSSVSVMFASAGVGLTLALEGVLNNFAGGVLILLLKPFSVGDYIIEDTNKNEGTVKEIRIFHTKLTTVDNRTIVIPNGTLTNNSLTNVTEKEERQLDLKVGISYQSDLKKAKELLEHLILAHPCVRKDESWKVFVDSLGDHAVILGIRAWVKTEDYWETRWALLEQIKLTFDEEGIDIPYNQLTIHMEKDVSHEE